MRLWHRYTSLYTHVLENLVAYYFGFPTSPSQMYFWLGFFVLISLTFLYRYKGLKLESLVIRMQAFWTLRVENQMETWHVLVS
jgi:hypothetical protein